MTTARTLLSARRVLIRALGTARANGRMREIIKDMRSTVAIGYNDSDVAFFQRIRSYESAAVGVPECTGTYSKGSWQCQCGADSPRECERRV